MTTKKIVTMQDWASGKVAPFEPMTCGHCLTEHVEYGCETHPEVKEAVLAAVGPLPQLYPYGSGGKYDEPTATTWLTEKLPIFRKLHRRFSAYYRRAS